MQLINNPNAMHWDCLFLISAVKRNIFFVRCDTFICGTNDFTRIDKFLNSVSRPTCNSCDCEHRCIQFHRQVKHTVNEARIKVHVCTDAFIHFAFTCDDLRSKSFNLEYKLNSSSLPFSFERLSTNDLKTFALGSESE